jgi:hypothetical protein
MSETVNTYTVLSGPALATMASNIGYLELVRDSGGHEAAVTSMCVIRRDKEKKSYTICSLHNNWEPADLEALTGFLKSVTSQSGGQSVVALDNSACLLAMILKGAMTAEDGTYIELPGLSLTLVAKAPTGNSFRFTAEMIQQMPTGTLFTASSASLTVSKA